MAVSVKSGEGHIGWRICKKQDVCRESLILMNERRQFGCVGLGIRCQSHDLGCNLREQRQLDIATFKFLNKNLLNLFNRS